MKFRFKSKKKKKNIMKTLILIALSLIKWEGEYWLYICNKHYITKNNPEAQCTVNPIITTTRVSTNQIVHWCDPLARYHSASHRNDEYVFLKSESAVSAVKNF